MLMLAVLQSVHCEAAIVQDHFDNLPLYPESVNCSTCLPREELACVALGKAEQCHQKGAVNHFCVFYISEALARATVKV